MRKKKKKSKKNQNQKQSNKKSFGILFCLFVCSARTIITDACNYAYNYRIAI